MATEKEVGAGGVETLERSLFEQIIEHTRPLDDSEAELNKSYIKEFVSHASVDQPKISADAASTINAWIAEIDEKLSAQLNEVMHDPAFQQLEGTWRGLRYLVFESETGTSLKIRVLNATKTDLLKDLETAVEFDQSALFKKIYEEEYGQLGGTPYGVLVGDYEFSRHPSDINLLRLLSNVAAAAHAPLISASSPELFNLQSFTELPNPRDLAKIFEGATHTSWRSFRESEDSRYVALTLPRVLGRLPYGEDFTKVEEFNFEEFVDGKDHSKYLWMNASWAFAARVTSAFSKYGWYAKIRGVEGGGKVENLPVHTFATDDGDVAMKCPTELAITDRREFELANLGFLSLLHAKNTDFAVFMGAQSAQKPKVYFDDNANSNAALSSRINYLLCVSRFAHYLKVMARDKIGSNLEVADCERWLNDWIANYVCDPSTAGDETKAKRPLSDARIEVREIKGRPGWYEAVAWLRPHFQLEKLDASMRLVAEVPKAS